MAGPAMRLMLGASKAAAAPGRAGFQRPPRSILRWAEADLWFSKQSSSTNSVFPLIADEFDISSHLLDHGDDQGLGLLAGADPHKALLSMSGYGKSSFSAGSGTEPPRTVLLFRAAICH